MTDFLPHLAKALDVHLPHLRSVAKILKVPGGETAESFVPLLAYLHLLHYATSEVALGILLERASPTIVGVINRSWALLDDKLVDLENGEPADVDGIPQVFEQHTLDVAWMAAHLFEQFSAAASPEAPPQPPAAAGGDPTASAAGTP